MSHTPAPWRIDFGDENTRPGMIAGIDGPEERIIETDGGFYGPTLADAHLISASPELLEFVQWYFDFCLNGEGSVAPRFDHARRLIAKAEGKTT